MSAEQVVLISMPWPVADRPSIQLGTLHGLLTNAGISVRSCSYYLKALDCFHEWTTNGSRPEESFTFEDYENIAENYFGVGLGDWIFSVPPYHAASKGEDEAYCQLLRKEGVSPATIAKAQVLRTLVPRLLDELCDEIVAAEPRIVGFTSVFSQGVPSLVLAKMIKARLPETHIVFGGANCDGPMGETLHRIYPWIDSVVRGEAEQVLLKLAREVIDGLPISPQPGLCHRNGDGTSIAIPQGNTDAISMDTVPQPVFEEYFQRLACSPLQTVIQPRVKIPYESARGCWWGAKSHCTFCGLNGSSMAFRAKSPDRVACEIYTLATKYKNLDFEVVDNIVSMEYLDTLLPRIHDLRRNGIDLTLFYETKANLRKDQLQMMRDAGVLRIQPGIESLSTPILKLMRKGVSALQNIRLLKWAAELDIDVLWNHLYAFPDEPQHAEYDRLADVVKSLAHLEPPSGMIALSVQRFSPYHFEANSKKWGYELVGPMKHYPFLYQTDRETLMDLVYEFEYRYTDGRVPTDYAANLIKEIKGWREMFTAAQSSRGTLKYRCGPGFMIIRDRRPNLEAYDYQLDHTQSEIYLACDAGAKLPAIVKHLANSGAPLCEVGQIEEFLAELVKARLVYEEDGTYLSLAIPSISVREDRIQRDEPVMALRIKTVGEPDRRRVELPVVTVAADPLVGWIRPASA